LPPKYEELSSPLTSIFPAIVTAPVARMMTGVFLALRPNLTVTLAGMLIVVKLKTPLSGI
jgi:hypothetical protein